MPIELPETINTILSIASFVIGAMIGSFLNVCVHRMPLNQSVVKPRSKCPKCEQPIAWFDNLPILSWLMLGAKCRNCSQPISWQYPLVEAITGTLFFFVFWHFGLVLATPIYMLLAASLVLVTFVDLTDWTIPNEVTIPGIFVGVVCALIGMIYPQSGLLLGVWWESFAGLFLGGGILYSIDKISLLLLKKRGMGFGDVKLMAMLGAFFGWKAAVLNIVVAAFLGSIIGIIFIVMAKRGGEKESKGHYLPFGPYIAVGGIVVMFFGESMINAYLSRAFPLLVTMAIP